MISRQACPIVVNCNHVGKCYHSYARPIDRCLASLRGLSPRWFGRHWPHISREFWALKDVSFDLYEGESLAIIGLNGSGKSTLLQLIAGTLNPSEGEIIVDGKVSAMLELGAGFHPEFTGIENVRINAALLGLSPTAIEEQLQPILDFAEIGDFAFMPVKTYSSGMYVRLAFSVMIHSSTDLLIIDEALSVGDAAFQAKCMMWMHDFKKAGGSLLFVSHDISAVRALCNRAIYLEQGQVKDMGDAGVITDHFLRDVHQLNNTTIAAVPAASDRREIALGKNTVIAPDLLGRFLLFEEKWIQKRQGTGEARIRLVELLDEHEQPLETLCFDDEVVIRIYAECLHSCSVSVNYKIRDKNMVAVAGADFLITQQPLLDMSAGQVYTVEYRTRLPLGPGDYTLRLSITEPIDKHAQAVFIDIVEVALPFKILPSPLGWIYTQVYLPNTLQVNKISTTSQPNQNELRN